MKTDITQEEMPDGLIQWHGTGSYHLCVPQVTWTDRDYGMLVKDTDLFGIGLKERGWAVTWDDPTYTIDTNGEIPFITARKGKINLIIFGDLNGYSAYERAGHVVRQLNLTDKEDRVLVFQAVCSDRNPETTTHVEDLSFD